MAVQKSEWTPIVEGQTGQQVADNLEDAFVNIDTGLTELETIVEESGDRNKLHGVINPDAELLTLNINPTKYNIEPFTYYIQGVEYQYGGGTLDGGFGTSTSDFKTINFNASGIFVRTNGFLTPEERDTHIEIGRIASAIGTTNITSLGDSVFFADEFMMNVANRFKAFTGSEFHNGTCKATKNTTDGNTIDIAGGYINTANLETQVISAEVQVAGYPIYKVSGLNTINPEENPLIAQNTQFSGVAGLEPIPTGEYAQHLILRSSGTGNYYLEYSDTTFTRLNDAIIYNRTESMFMASGSEVEPLAKVIVQEGATEIIQMVDIRDGKQLITGEEASEAEEVEFRASSTAATQEPIGTDSPIQIEFGVAQSGDNASIDSLGNITILTSGEYHFDTLLHFGRIGGTGESELFGRTLVNGIQLEPSIHAKLTDAETVFPHKSFNKNYFNAGDVITFEVYRDSGGNNSGGLFAYIPNLAGWDVAPTASISVIKHQ